MKKIIIYSAVFFSILAGDSKAQYKGGSYDGYYSGLDTSIIYPLRIENLLTDISDFHLYQNYPNPFNPATVIRYYLAKSSFVSISVYDISGKLTATLINKRQGSGEHQIVFDANDFPAGIYFCKLTSENGSKDLPVTRKMILIK